MERLTILVTGGAGFIGSHLVQELSKNHQIVIFDDLSTGKKENIMNLDNITFVKGDVSIKSQVKQLFNAFQFYYIYHLAAVASVEKSIQNPIETNITNFFGTLFLLEAVRKYNDKKLKKFIFASSAAVYGIDPTLPKVEYCKIEPTTPYAIDKFSSERYILAYGSLYGLNTTVARFFNVYGPGQILDSPYSGVISVLSRVAMERKLGKRSTFQLYGDGMQTRDFVYVKDVVTALQLIGESSKSRQEVFNIGSGQRIDLNKTIRYFEALSGITIPTKQLPERKVDIKHSYGSIEKIKNIGFLPIYSFEEGLKEYIEHPSL